LRGLLVEFLDGVVSFGCGVNGLKLPALELRALFRRRQRI
jgi:hypothetical protein